VRKFPRWGLTTKKGNDASHETSCIVYTYRADRSGTAKTHVSGHSPTAETYKRTDKNSRIGEGASGLRHFLPPSKNEQCDEKSLSVVVAIKTDLPSGIGRHR